MSEKLWGRCKQVASMGAGLLTSRPLVLIWFASYTVIFGYFFAEYAGVEKSFPLLSMWEQRFLLGMVIFFSPVSAIFLGRLDEAARRRWFGWLPTALASPLLVPFVFMVYLVASIPLVASLPVVLIGSGVGVLLTGLGVFVARMRLRQGIELRCHRGGCEYARVSFTEFDLLYLCPGKCGNAYDGLMPSKYGLLTHKCTCGGELPASKQRRRRTERSLRKLCPGGHEWRSDRRALRASFVAVVGTNKAGKTHFIVQCADALLRSPHWRAEFDNAHVERRHRDNMQKLSKGLVLPATSRGEPRADYVLRLGPSGGRKQRLYLYDASGEDYVEDADVSEAGFRFYEALTGVVLIVDPELLPRFRRNRVIDTSDPGLSRVVAVLLDQVGKYTSVLAARGGGIPLSVVINKADKPPVRRAVTNASGQWHEEACQIALREWGAGADIDRLSTIFSPVRFFACTTQGREYREGDARPFEARGVVQPVASILGFMTRRA